MSFRDPLAAALERIAALEAELRRLRQAAPGGPEHEELVAARMRLQEAEQAAALARAELEAEVALMATEREAHAALREAEHERHRQELEAERTVQNAELECSQLSVQQMQRQLEAQERAIAALRHEVELLVFSPDDALVHFAQQATELEAQLDRLDRPLAPPAAGPDRTEERRRIEARVREGMKQRVALERDLVREQLGRVKKILEALSR